jgi:hypothetical protein
LHAGAAAGDVVPCEQLVYFKLDTPSVDAGIARYETLLGKMGTNGSTLV